LERAVGLREEKKAQARRRIADAASELFGEHGFANVAMVQVARAAGVSEQTLYNYFPTKESLVFDEGEAFERTLVAMVADRPASTGLIDACGTWLDAFLLGEAAHRAVETPGGMPRQVALSEQLRRALLDLAHRTAGVLAARLTERDGYPAPHAKVLADAVLSVFVRVVVALGAASGRSAVKRIAADAHAALDALRALER
jgi:AcrR family transcriptional regulator